MADLLKNLVVSTSERRWDPRVKLFSWTVAVLFVLMIPIGIAAQVLFSKPQLNVPVGYATLLAPQPAPTSTPVAAKPEKPRPTPTVAPNNVAVRIIPDRIDTSGKRKWEPPPTNNVTDGVPGAPGDPNGDPRGVPGIPVGPPNDNSPPPPPPPVVREQPKPAPEPPKIVRKSGGVLQGSATRRVEPNYPPLAKTARVSGQVIVEVTVDETGTVISARAISGHPLLKDAAVNAARGWKFTPTQLSGSPVKVIGTITFNFNL